VTAAPILAGRRVAITRPEPGPLASRLAAVGAQIVHVPLIEVSAPADGGAQLSAVLSRLPEFDWLVVTSANGAARVGAAARAAPDVRLAAVGPTTAAVLAAGAGRPIDLVPTTARAEGLLAEFPRRPQAHVLLAQADRARAVLAEGLVSAGHTVESVVAYRTVERGPSTTEAVALLGADLVVLASGSAARSYARVLDAAGRLDRPPVVVCIGPVTAEEARRVGVPVDHVADRPDPTTLTTLVTEALDPRPR
jgi:uroporphyrinogen-III synthase